MRTTRMPTARSWILMALPAALALGGCDRSPTEPESLPDLLAAKGGPGAAPLLAFVSDHEVPGGAIYTVRADGSGLKQLTAPESGQSDMHPDFAPGNKQIVFRRILSSAVSELFVVPLKGKRITQLTSFSAQTRRPVYSPDGSRIAFVSTMDGPQDLYVMNADGTNVQRLTSTPEHEDSPTWSPDGTRIGYSIKLAIAGYPSQIRAMDLGTMQYQVLVDCPTDVCTGPRWHRTQDELVYEFGPQNPVQPTMLYYRNLLTNASTALYGTYAHFVGEWMPGGGGFVFTSNRMPPHDRMDVFVRIGQGGPTQVTFFGSGNARDATWSR